MFGSTELISHTEQQQRIIDFDRWVKIYVFICRSMETDRRTWKSSPRRVVVIQLCLSGRMERNRRGVTPYKTLLYPNSRLANLFPMPSLMVWYDFFWPNVRFLVRGKKWFLPKGTKDCKVGTTSLSPQLCPTFYGRKMCCHTTRAGCWVGFGVLLVFWGGFWWVIPNGGMRVPHWIWKKNFMTSSSELASLKIGVNDACLLHNNYGMSLFRLSLQIELNTFALHQNTKIHMWYGL